MTTTRAAAPVSTARSERSCRRLIRQARRRMVVVAGGGAALALLLVLAVAPAGAAAAEAEGWRCDGIQHASPWTAPSVWWEADGSYFTQLRSDDGALALRSVLRLYPLAQRDAEQSKCAAGGEAVTQVCVALVDTTAYTSDGPLQNVAWVTLHTDALQPVAVVEVDAACWARERSSLSRCKPCLLATENLQMLPLYHYSPLSREFWVRLSSETMPPSSDPRRPWLHRINMQANANRSARAEWLRLAQVPQLRSLELTGNSWGGEGGAPRLPPLPSLGELRLHANRLTALPDDYLTQSPLLEMLILARNSLTHLPKSIANLKILRLLDVTNPLSLGQTFSVDYISRLPNLRILGLENQKLVGDIVPILMMPSLIFLNMSGCGLKDLGNPSRFPPHTTDLQVMDLSFNSLEVVSSSFLSRYPKLTRLLLNENNLRILGDSSLLPLPKLDYLDVSHNHLKNLPKLKPNSIKVLKAGDNVLEDFDEDFWESFPTIEVLDLSQNRLTEVPVLRSQENLQNLDLSQNEIKVLHGLSFGQLNNLKSINISNNLLTTLDSNVLNNLQELKMTDLSHNRLWHISLLNGNMEILYLSHNLLTTVPPLNMTFLYRLSLKRNLITSVNFSNMYVIKLRELDLSWNKISVAELANLTLDSVDLTFNSLRFMPTGSSKTRNIKVEGNPFNGAEKKEDEVPSGAWDSWFFWILGGIVALVIITIVLLVGVAILFRKLMKRSEPLVLSTRRSPSPESFGESTAVRFK